MQQAQQGSPGADTLLGPPCNAAAAPLAAAPGPPCTHSTAVHHKTHSTAAHHRHKCAPRRDPPFSCAWPPCTHNTGWNLTNLAQSDDTPDCELNAVTARRQFFGFPYCHTVPANGNPYYRPFLRPPGASATADPDQNLGQRVMNCTGECGACGLEGRLSGVEAAAWLPGSTWKRHALACVAQKCLQCAWHNRPAVHVTIELPHCLHLAPAAGPNLQFRMALQAMGPHTAPLGMVRPRARAAWQASPGCSGGARDGWPACSDVRYRASPYCPTLLRFRC